MIIKSIIDYFVGTVKVTVKDRSKRDRFFDHMISNKIGFDIIDDENSLTVRISACDSDKIRRYADEIGEVQGFRRIIKRYGKRWGVYVGILIVAVMIIVSQRLVWRIDVTGCEEDMKEDVVSKLESLGFTYGTDFKEIDFDALHNDYLRKFDDLSWISVNMNGTWATVEVKEARLPEEESNDGVMNVIAAESGVITGIEPVAGKPLVSVGDFVSEGELLISGIITVGDDGLRFEASEGRVFARVKRNFAIEIPKSKSTKVYTGEEFNGKRLIFFKNSVKLSGNYRISPREYDTIYNKDRVYLFGTVPLPIFFETLTYREYDVERREVSYGEAITEFELKYPQFLNATLCGANLLGISYVESETEGSYVREYEVVCEADIAEQKCISVK